MAVEPGFQVRLGIYEIDDDVVDLRAEIWRLLAPRLDSIVATYLAHILKVAPLYRKKMEEGRKAYTDRFKYFMERLLNNPFDEEWVKDAYDRATAEASSGLDMRSRSAITIAVLNDLSKCIYEHHRFSPHKGFRLLNAATRIFMLDAANAVACYNSMEVQQAKARSEELANSIKSFAHSVDGVREIIANVAKSISSTSDRLAELGNTASGQTDMAAHAAEDTASRIGSIAAATDELNASIEEIHAQVMGSAETAQKAVSHSALPITCA